MPKRTRCSTRLRAALLAEAPLDSMALQRLAERVERLLITAPELAFSFRVTLSAEGPRPDAETLDGLNELLEEVQPGFRPIPVNEILMPVVSF